jgi:hypothetical protein
MDMMEWLMDISSEKRERAEHGRCSTFYSGYIRVR